MKEKNKCSICRYEYDTNTFAGIFTFRGKGTKYPVFICDECIDFLASHLKDKILKEISERLGRNY